MYNKIIFDKEIRTKQRQSQYDAERQETHDFLASKHKNCVMEYGSQREAKNAFQAIRKYIIEAKQPLRVSQTNKIFIVLTREDREGI